LKKIYILAQIELISSSEVKSEIKAKAGKALKTTLL
jgi:hypothetical protein